VSDVAEALEGLRRKFLARSADDLTALRAWSAKGAPADDDMRRLVHRLAGAAGTFGFHSLSDHAKRVDDGMSGGVDSTPGLVEALIGELAALRA
jgi:HPt (histidine-containing phosphotransfer) domain-containing protein